MAGGRERDFEAQPGGHAGEDVRLYSTARPRGLRIPKAAVFMPVRKAPASLTSVETPLRADMKLVHGERWEWWSLKALDTGVHNHQNAGMVMQ